MVVGIVSYWMVHDFPDRATFLSDDDRARVIRRLKEDQQASAEHEVRGDVSGVCCPISSFDSGWC